MEEVISKESATAEVSKWLDSLNVEQDLRDDPYIQSVIKKIVRAIMDGHWVFNDDETITQKLRDKIGDNITHITYNGRYTIGDWHAKVKKLQPGDNLGTMIAKLSLLSDLPEKTFASMTKRDYDVASNVAVFF